METGAKFDQRRDTALDFDRSTRRLGNACDELERRALARAVTADHPVRRPFRNRERNLSERRKGLTRGEIAQDAALEQRALQRGELTAAVPAVDLRDVVELYRIHDSTPTMGRIPSSMNYTASAKESRRRSKNQYPAKNRRTETPPRASSHFA